MTKYIIALLLTCLSAQAQVPAGYKVLCVRTNVDMNSINLPGAGATDRTAYRYEVISTTGAEVWVSASATGITASVNSGVLTFSIPAGTVLHSARIRCPDSSLVVDAGTDDMANTGLADRWGCTMVAYREDTGARQATATIALDTDHASKVTISGLTGGGVTSHIILTW